METVMNRSSYKILFLDNDGVICLSSEWGSRFKGKRYGLDKTFDNFNKGAVEILNEIITETECEIVISSDWRLHCSLAEMQALFLERGIKKAPIDYTPVIKMTGEHLMKSNEEIRSIEILKWLETWSKFGVSTWCAVDDLDMGPYLNNFVLTPRDREGIKQTGIKRKIVKALNGK